MSDPPHIASYYERSSSENSDGTPLFSIDLDKQNEDEAAAAIEAAWRCELHKFGRLCPIDYYALRDGRMVGLLEVKSRTHPRGRYPTVFLNVRKWLVLRMGELGMAVPAIFVVKFTDGLYSIPIADVDARRLSMGGTQERVKSDIDIEPVIEIPIPELKEIRRK